MSPYQASVEQRLTTINFSHSPGQATLKFDQAHGYAKTVVYPRRRMQYLGGFSSPYVPMTPHLFNMSFFLRLKMEAFLLSSITQPSSVLESLYATILDLDRRIRDFLIPALLRNCETESSSIVLQKASLGTTLVNDRCLMSLKPYANELLQFFLQLHMSFFRL